MDIYVYNNQRAENVKGFTLFVRLKKTDYWAPEIAKNNLQYLISDLRIPAYPYDFSFLTSQIA